MREHVHLFVFQDLFFRQLFHELPYIAHAAEGIVHGVHDPFNRSHLPQLLKCAHSKEGTRGILDVGVLDVIKLRIISRSSRVDPINEHGQILSIVPNDQLELREAIEKSSAVQSQHMCSDADMPVPRVGSQSSSPCRGIVSSVHI